MNSFDNIVKIQNESKEQLNNIFVNTNFNSKNDSEKIRRIETMQKHTEDNYNLIKSREKNNIKKRQDNLRVIFLF